MDYSDLSTTAIPPQKYIQNYRGDDKSTHPPPPPTPLKNEPYRMFGKTYLNTDDFIPPLDPDTASRLPSVPCDHNSELHKLHYSILVNFLDLLTVLTDSPANEARTQKLSDLNTLFINMNQLINEFRPHQAREFIIEMMNQQIQQRNEILTRLDAINSDICEQTRLVLDGDMPVFDFDDADSPSVEGPSEVETVPPEEDELTFIKSIMLGEMKRS